MSQTKKYGPDEKDLNLKREDQRKSYGNGGAGAARGVDFLGGKRVTEKTVDPNVKVKKKLPLAVDIIAGILMLALVCGVVVGSYMLFRYYSNDYDTKNITYTVLFVANKELDEYGLKKTGELYMDVSGNAVYFGKIEEVKRIEHNGVKSITLKVKADVKYRSGEGYSIEDTRIAVGSEFKLRYLAETLNVSVVELDETGGD